MPKLRAQILCHANAVAGIGACGGVQQRIALKKLIFHCRAAFEAAGGEHYAAPCFDCALDAVRTYAYAVYLTCGRIDNQAQSRRCQSYLNAVLDEIVVHDLEQFGAIGRAIRPRIRSTCIEAGHIDYRGVIERIVAGKRVIRVDAATIRISFLITRDFPLALISNGSH
jgi:hypothetical protein